VTISETPQLDWLLLTKRPENIRRFLPPYVSGKDWPNVWLGTTVENQHFANERIPHLLDVPAAVHFISAEPLLGPLDLTHIQETGYDRDALDLNRWQPPWTPNAKIDWVIAGGESGAAYRLSLPEWFRSLRDQCVSAGVAFHFKQWGGRTPKANGRVLDGREWNEFPDGGIERQSDNAVAKGRKVL
jgi:protein gp37